MAPLPTTTFAVLGAISTQPMSGYQVAQFVSSSIAHFFPISKSQVYGELARLEELGYVQGRNVRQEKLPDKTTYRISKAGRQALSEWLADPSYQPERYRSAFLVKVFFGRQMPPETLLEMLTEYRDKSLGYAKFLETIVTQLQGQTETKYMAATAAYGLKVSQAAVQWSEDVIKQMRKEETKR